MESQTHIALSLLLFFSLFSFDLSYAFTPSDNYLINSGSPADTIVDGRVFIQDGGKSGSILSSMPRISITDPNISPESHPLYHTARVFTEPSSYRFKINKKGTHLVRFHFFALISPSYNLSSALFHVSALEFLLMKDFAITDDRTPVFKEYLINVNTDELVIQFAPSRKSSIAFVNAIEVVSVPDDLIADVASFITPFRLNKYHGLSGQALETVYRINVGGPKITPFNDSLWRTWVPDQDFLRLKSAAKAVSFSGPIRYQKGGASREIAPNHVYNSAQEMNMGANVGRPNFNITWIFPVKPRFLYLVRLHFCDIVSSAVSQLYFNVYINGLAAYLDLDLSLVTTQVLAAPYYADFVIGADDSGVLTISVGPSDLSSASRINAILNGLEIMKMNNSMGSLDSDSSVNLMLQSGSGKNGASLVRSTLGAVGFISLFAAFLLVLRRSWANKKDSVAWTPLSNGVSEGHSKCGDFASYKSGFLGRFKLWV